MRRALLIFLLLAGLGSATPRVAAFSLLGATPTWFNDNAGQFPNQDIFGPVNLGEEYRWTVPSVVYAFDESFVNYFGQKGIDEVEKAIAILNAVPQVSTVDIDAFPTHSQRVNYRARDLGIFDLKSYTLKLLLEQLGLGSPGRHVFQSRLRYVQGTPPLTNYLVFLRNFDPETWNPTAYINGQLWTYTDIFDNQDSPTVKSSTVTEPVDPLILAEPVAAVISGFSFSVFGIGSYITGLTRDDVGGLRYIYRPDNLNTETLPADASGSAGFGGGAAGGDGAWVGIPAPATNTGGGTGGTTNNVVFYSQAIRGGRDKVTFVKGPVVYQPNGYQVTNRFEETIIAVITNGVQREVRQRVARVSTVPDVLFTARDLTNPDATVDFTDRTGVATSNDAINGNATLDGPGQFGGTALIAFNKTGGFYFNIAPSFLGQPSAFSGFVWGSFDGTTNDPVVYPIGTSIKDVEQRAFGGR